MSSPQVPHSVSGQIACLHGQGQARANAQDRAELGGVSQSQAGQAEPAAWPLGL